MMVVFVVFFFEDDNFVFFLVAEYCSVYFGVQCWCVYRDFVVVVDEQYVFEGYVVFFIGFQLVDEKFLFFFNFELLISYFYDCEYDFICLKR